VSFLSSVVDHILKLRGLEAYLLVGGLAFAEAALLCRSPRYMGRFLAVVATLRVFADIQEHIEALRRGLPIKGFPWSAVELRGRSE